MGFGVLFIGYFLLLNVTNYTFTDLCCGAILAFALSKLAPINKSFRFGMIAALAFTAIGAIEFVSEALIMLKIMQAPLSFVFPVRTVATFATACLIMRGIFEVCEEVELKRVGEKTKRAIPFLCLNALINLFLGIPLFYSPIPSIVTAGIFTANLLLGIGITLYNLITIYTAYANICMPNQPKAHKKDGFLDRLERRQEERNREYMEYKKSKREDKRK